MTRQIFIFYLYAFFFIGAGCAKDHRKTLEDQFTERILADIAKCAKIDSFRNETLDSLPFKIDEYDELLNDCFYPLFGKTPEKELSYLQQVYNVSGPDIGYFVLCKIHSELNGKKENRNTLMITSKEIKYQRYVREDIRKDADQDRYVLRAQNIRYDIGDTLLLEFLVNRTVVSDTAEVCFYGLFIDYDTPDPYESIYVKGVVTQSFDDIVEGNPIYYLLRIVELEEEAIKIYNHTYSRGSIIPLDMLKYGGKIESSSGQSLSSTK